MKIIQRVSIIAASLLTSFSLLLAPAVVHAQTSSKAAICEGVALTGSGCNVTSGPSVDSVIATVINILSIVVGVAAVVMIIVGGMKYILSSGDSNNINSAKNTILYALVGLVIVALAQVLVRYVLNQVAP